MLKGVHQCSVLKSHIVIVTGGGKEPENIHILEADIIKLWLCFSQKLAQNDWIDFRADNSSIDKL